jgi:integrase
MRRSKPPRRQPGLRWIYPRWRESPDRWEWAPAVRVNGKLVWGASHAEQEDAFKAAKEIRSRHAVSVAVGEITLRQATEKVVGAMLANGGSEVTAKGYRFRFGKWFEILDPEAPIIAIEPADVEHLKARRRELHGAGGCTVRTDLVLLQRAFDLAGLRGERNPVRGVARPKVIDPHRAYFTMAEVGALVVRIRAAGDDAAADLILFLALTGARAWEVGRLRREHVRDTPDGGCVVVLHGTKGKRQAAREVFVAAGSADVVRRLVRDAVHAPPIEPVKIAVVCRRWSRSLGEPRLSGRVLRRTYATANAMALPLHYVQGLMGHTQLTTTQKYLGVDPRLGQAAAVQLHSALAGKPQRASRPRGRRRGGRSATTGTRATRPATRPDADSPSSACPDPNG